MIVLLLIINISCSDKISGKLNGEIPQSIKVEELKNLLPEKLRNSGQIKLIFIDKYGSEFIVIADIKSVYNQMLHNGIKYEAESFVIDYLDVKNDISVRIQLSTNLYSKDENSTLEIAQGINIANLASKSPFGLLINYDLNRKAISQLGSKKVNKIQLLNKEFNNVYVCDAGFTEYDNEIRFNFEKGLISYSDLSNNLYIFERFEN